MRFRVRFLAAVACALPLMGCTLASPPSPALRAFGDNGNWVTAEDMVYAVGHTHQSISVPKGFVTDFASIPKAFWSLGLSPYGRYSRAAIIHDYLYWTQACTRAQADRLLLIAMKESKVGKFNAFAIYQAVDKFGDRAWEKDAKERVAGLPRIIPERYLLPADPNMTWAEYRQVLVSQGVKDPPFEQNPSYCALGDSTLVP